MFLGKRNEVHKSTVSTSRIAVVQSPTSQMPPMCPELSLRPTRAVAKAIKHTNSTHHSARQTHSMSVVGPGLLFPVVDLVSTAGK